MAAELLRHLWEASGPAWPLIVTSAGTHAFPGLDATEHAATAMRERGRDLSGHTSRSVTAETLTDVDLILTVTDRHKQALLQGWPDLMGRVFTLGEYAGQGQDVPDPFGGSLEDYRQTARSLEQFLGPIIKRIRLEGA